MINRRSSLELLGVLAFAWGITGFIGLLVYAIVRLTPIALASAAHEWHAGHWLLFVVNIAAMAWYEGYRGFQCSYSPRLAARCVYLLRHATPLRCVLAPLFCMGFMHTTRRRIIGACLLTAGVMVAVAIYRALPQPWRGILDAGVVVGLTWGALATVYWTAKLLSNESGIDPEVVSATP